VTNLFDKSSLSNQIYFMLNRIKAIFMDKPVDLSNRVTTDELLQKNYDLYDEKTIDYALHESEKSLADTLVIFRKINEISFIILSVYLTILGFVINKIIDSKSFGDVDFSVVIIMGGVIMALCYLWPNLWEDEMWEIGVRPSVFINEDYEQVDLGKQLKMVKVQKLALNQNGIYHNRDKNKLRNKNIKCSIYSITIAFILASLCVII